MAVVPMIQPSETGDVESRPVLRLVVNDVTAHSFGNGPTLRARRAARARMMQRRRRAAVAVALVAGLVILALPGHAFGGVTGTGLSTDLATSTVLASGMSYVVQPGDTVQSIAELANPVDPREARTMLVRQLRSATVVVGEHIVIP